MAFGVSCMTITTNGAVISTTTMLQSVCLPPLCRASVEVPRKLRVITHSQSKSVESVGVRRLARLQLGHERSTKDIRPPTALRASHGPARQLLFSNSIEHSHCICVHFDGARATLGGRELRAGYN